MATTVRGQKLLEKLHRSIELAKNCRPLNAFITETFETALEEGQAKISAAETSAQNEPSERTHPLLGVPIAVKDCFCTKGVQTSCGSQMLDGFIPPYTATVVERLSNAGAVMMGKTNMDEYSMGISTTNTFYGPSKNPWTLFSTACNNNEMDTEWHLCGGSSGGSAIAVACDIAKIGLGSDTGGSTRNPAAFCGVVGLKSTYGLLSRHGLIPLVNSLDVPGIITRTVDDAALALDVMAGFDPKDPTSVQKPCESYIMEETEPDIKGLRIGIPKEYFMPGLSQEVWDVWNRVAGLLEREGGSTLHQVSLPHTQYSILCYHVIGECDVASNMARYDGVEFGYRDLEEDKSVDSLYATNRHDAFNEVVRRRILVGNYFLLRENFEKYYAKAMKVRRLIAEDFDNVFGKSAMSSYSKTASSSSNSATSSSNSAPSSSNSAMSSANSATSSSSSFEHTVDILLTPVTSTDAPLLTEFQSDDEGYGRERMDDFFTQPSNMAGVPAVTIPISLSSRGLPISLQLISNKFNEKQLLIVAKWIEKRVQFPSLDVDLMIQKMKCFKK